MDKGYSVLTFHGQLQYTIMDKEYDLFHCPQYQNLIDQITKESQCLLFLNHRANIKLVKIILRTFKTITISTTIKAMAIAIDTNPNI